MQQVIWINGAFGVGKTTVARALVKRCPGMVMFDPEQIGFLLRRAIPDECRPADFQDLALWRDLTARTILGIVQQCGGERPVVVPMTVARLDYFEEMLSRLNEGGVRVQPFTLTASPRTLKMRLWTRWSSPASKRWTLAQIERCTQAFAESGVGIRVTTDGRRVGHIVDDLLHHWT